MRRAHRHDLPHPSAIREPQVGGDEKSAHGVSDEIYRAWQWIQAAQFPNVNIDLISGMVGETWDNWKDCVRRVVELSPDSVTIYQMEVPYNTTIYQRMKAEGKLEEALDLAEQNMSDGLAELVSDQGMNFAEAKEMLLPQYIFLPPEPKETEQVM